MSEDSVTPAEKFKPDVSEALSYDDERPLPFRRNITAECPCCWMPAGFACDPFCISRLTAEEQVAHRDAVLERTMAELAHVERPKRDRPAATLDCTLGAGRHRANPPASPWRAALAVLVVFLVLTAGALWWYL